MTVATVIIQSQLRHQTYSAVILVSLGTLLKCMAAA